MPLPTYVNRVNPDVYPPDGWFYEDPEGVRHVGESLKHLIEAVTSYRLRLGRGIGDPAQDVYDFTCARYPNSCKNGVRTVPKPASSVTPLAGAVVQWLSKVYRGLLRIPDARVSGQEANRRGSICLKCPRQRSWINGCGSCNASINQLGMQIRNGEDVRNGVSLRACSVLMEDTRTSVWLDRLQPVANDQLPPGCWRKAK